MKKIFLLSIWLLLSIFVANSQTTKTVGGIGADYSTLKLAFDAINTGNITGNITLQITGSTTETASASINASGVGTSNYTLINIYPAIVGISISGNSKSVFSVKVVSVSSEIIFRAELFPVCNSIICCSAFNFSARIIS